VKDLENTSGFLGSCARIEIRTQLDRNGIDLESLENETSRVRERFAVYDDRQQFRQVLTGDDRAQPGRTATYARSSVPTSTNARGSER
jgi:hypothetical protein